MNHHHDHRDFYFGEDPHKTRFLDQKITIAGSKPMPVKHALIAVSIVVFIFAFAGKFILPALAAFAFVVLALAVILSPFLIPLFVIHLISRREKRARSEKNQEAPTFKGPAFGYFRNPEAFKSPMDFQKKRESTLDRMSRSNSFINRDEDDTVDTMNFFSKSGNEEKDPSSVTIPKAEEAADMTASAKKEKEEAAEKARQQQTIDQMEMISKAISEISKDGGNSFTIHGSVNKEVIDALDKSGYDFDRARNGGLIVKW